jgi:hypothetical protein
MKIWIRKAQMRQGGMKVRAQVARRAQRLALKLRQRGEENIMKQATTEAARSATALCKTQGRGQGHHQKVQYRQIIRESAKGVTPERELAVTSIVGNNDGGDLDLDVDCGSCGRCGMATERERVFSAAKRTLISKRNALEARAIVRRSDV